MKTLNIEGVTLDTCVDQAQREQIVVTRAGRPVALIVGVEGLDEEQIALGSSPEFWEMIAERRRQRSMSRAELERMLDQQE